MFIVTEQESRALQDLGDRLKTRRIETRDTQLAFAARVGVSVPTYRKLERGDPTAPIGAWVRAIRLLGGMGGIEALLPVALLSDAAGRRRAPKRKRSLEICRS